MSIRFAYVWFYKGAGDRGTSERDQEFERIMNYFKEK